MTDSSSVIVRILVWSCWLVLLSDSVDCQISASAGSDVLLNCSYKTSSEINIYWSYKGEYPLVDIINGTTTLSDQDERFRDRVITFPELYAVGNYSVVLKNVRLSDAGPYICHIPRVPYQRQLDLTVFKPTERPTTAQPGATSPPSGRNASVRVHYCYYYMTLIMLFFIILRLLSI